MRTLGHDNQEVGRFKQDFKPTPTALSASARVNACVRVGFCTKSWHCAAPTSATTPSKTSPERLIFEKTGVEIQCQT
jgi:hypothetical protein